MTARRASSGAVLLLLLASGGCSYLMRGEALQEPVNLLAVLPLVRLQTSAAPTAAGDDEAPRPQLAPEADRVVTAQVYSGLAGSPRWRFVPDLTVSDALRKVSRSSPLTEQAQQLGRAVNADAVLTGTVSRF